MGCPSKGRSSVSASEPSIATAPGSSQAATAVLAARIDAGTGLSLVTLAVGPEHASSFRAPGQYVQVTTAAGATGYFALAGELGSARWELLVRNSGDAADALVTLPIGAPIDVTLALGEGFPLASAEGRPLIVAVAGSAIAVARPIVRARGIGWAEPGSTTVFVGARCVAEVPLADELEAWTTHGIETVLCLSRPELADESERLRHVRRFAGYTQFAIEEHLRVSAERLGTSIRSGGPRPRPLLFAAGGAPMLQSMRELGERGLVDVVTNV